jgi:nucleoside-diphosphate-sugar epimerase
MNYYISGMSGFIGGAISKYLTDKGDNVFRINRNLTIAQIRLRRFHPDYIIHTATYGNHYDQKDFRQMVETNIMGTYNLLEAVKEFDYKKFYNFTTSSVLLKDQTYYSITKYCGEQLAGMYKNVVNIRPYSVYGPGEASHRFIPTVINCLNTGNEMILDETATHAWIYIDDFVKAMFAGETELGGMSITNKEIVSILEEISGKKLKYKSGVLRNYNCGDCEAPGRLWGTDIVEGLKLTYEHYSRQNN